MTAGIFDDASMVTIIVRVRNVAASIGWFRETLGLEPIDVGAEWEASEVRRSAKNEFMWFHELDGNRFELSRPLSGSAESALVAHEPRVEP